MARYAVVGMDCVLPGAIGAEAWIALQTPQFREVPAGRWPMPPGGVAGEVPSTAHGAFVEGFVFDPTGLADPAPFEALDPLFAWVTHVVRGALPPGADRARTSLALACLGLPSTGMVRAVAAPILDHLGVEVGWLRRSGAVPPDELLPASGPARVAAAALGLGGEVDALDAACASGLFAVRAAIDRLASGETSLAVAAAVNRSDTSYLFQGFSRLQALSTGGVARPLDQRADGLVVGEGAVAVALRRLEDALRDGDPIHAVIRAVGLGSDGRKGNMLAPAAAGQLRAMRAAWAAAQLDPASVGAVECHATGTSLGDATEVRALTELLAHRRGPPVALSSAKGLVGHTVTAAGLAGLLRAIGAVRDGILPAAVGCERPRAELVGNERVVALAAPEPWAGPTRRAAVSAFGFGGTNAHLVVDRFDPGEAGPVRVHAAPPDLAVVAVALQVGPDRDQAWLDAPTPEAPAPASITRGLGPARVGRWIPEVAVDPWRFRIPPTEVAEILPQQLLALELAADAAARCPRFDPARTGAVIGFEVDPQVAEGVVRWALAAEGHRAAADAVHPPLVAARVQGALPNFVACRIAAQLGLEGPSYAVAAGPRSGTQALRHAARLLVDPGLEAVVVGAVDLRGPRHGPALEAGVVLVVRRLQDAVDAGDAVIAALSARGGHPTANGGASVAVTLVRVVEAIRTGRPARVDGVEVSPRGPMRFPATGAWDRALVVPHSLAPLPRPAFAGPFGGPTVPRPRVRDPGAVDDVVVLRGPPSVGSPIAWPRSARARAGTPAAPGIDLAVDPGVAALALATARAACAVADAHQRFLDAQEQALAPVVALAEGLARAAGDRRGGILSREALLRHAGGTLESVFGHAWADLDRFEPRVRMPLPPLLLVDRVVALEGTRGTFGPSRIVTEYDVPHAAGWSADDRPPACVVVESGQADLLLVSYLGIDEICRGERVYRLLDCDLRFLAPRPAPGTTLRHDIRIDRFARLGATTLFWFRYDCTDAGTGRPVLQMRDGCAGFFTPAELARPRGIVETPAAPASAPIAPLLGPPPPTLDEGAVAALASGQASRALGPRFAPADGSALRLPPDPRWRLVHRVAALQIGGVGLGSIRAEQDLRDDDWFNAVHFQGDPCMPGTLMLEGCLQTVQVWLLALGAGAVAPDGRFEVGLDRPIRLRCRGQVAPGHRLLTYDARIVDAGRDPLPWAVADVVLAVDGCPVVLASGVSVRVIPSDRRVARRSDGD